MTADRNALAQTPPSGQFVEVDGTTIHYQIEGSGPDVVLLHGAGGNLRDMTFELSGLLKDRFRVISIDRPGHGYSSRIASRAELGETPQEQAAVLVAAARQIGVKDPIVVGHSFGGIVSLAWALNHPDDIAGLVMLAGVSNEWEGGLDRWYDVTTTWAGRNLLVPVLSAIAPRSRVEDTTAGIFAPDPVPEGYLDHVGVALSKSKTVLQATTQQVKVVKPHVVALEARQSALTLPIEIVHGDKDETVPLEVHGRVLARKAPNANLTVLEGIGHMPHHAGTDATVAAIERAAKRAGTR